MEETGDPGGLKEAVASSGASLKTCAEAGSSFGEAWANVGPVRRRGGRALRAWWKEQQSASAARRSGQLWGEGWEFTCGQQV